MKQHIFCGFLKLNSSRHRMVMTLLYCGWWWYWDGLAWI